MARACFCRLGFHVMSMLDILRKADVSAGALYCYFRSKDDIVGAIVDEVLNELTTRVEALASRASPPSTVEIAEPIFSVLEERDPSHELANLAIQVGAESLFDPRLGTRIASGYHQLRDGLIRLVELPGTPATAIAQLLTALGPAYLLQRALLGNTEANGFRAALGALLVDH